MNGKLTPTALVDFLYYKRLPKVYHDMDADPVLNYPLYRYLQSLVVGGYSEALEDINGILNLVDPEKCPEEFLPYLCESFGLKYYEDIDIIYQRRLLANVGEIIKRRGTYSCVKYLVKVLTNMDTHLTLTEEGGEKTLNIVLLIDTIEQIEDVATNISVVERYISDVIPFFITPEVGFQINTTVVQSNQYHTNLISYYVSYTIA